MKVTPIAHTIITTLPESIVGTPFGDRVDADLDHGVSDADLLAEFAGRSCYQSWSLPNPKTAENHGYIGNIIDQGHFSVLEHASVTFYVEGVSRSLTHELIRHRHLSYSELSQRYVNVEDAEIVVPPALRDRWENHGDAQGATLLGEQARNNADAYRQIAEALQRAGLPRKRAREAARAVMPNAIETKIVVTGNLRAWRDFLGKRWHVAADAEIQEFAGQVLDRLRALAPASVQDVPAEPYGKE